MLTTDCPGLKLIARGKVRDIYALPNQDDRLLFVATDRISAYDVILDSVRFQVLLPDCHWGRCCQEGLSGSSVASGRNPVRRCLRFRGSALLPPRAALALRRCSPLKGHWRSWLEQGGKEALERGGTCPDPKGASSLTLSYALLPAQSITDKGKLLTSLSLFWFDKLASIIPNHLILPTSLASAQADWEQFPESCKPYEDQLKGRSMVVRKCEVVKIEAIVRGYITGQQRPLTIAIKMDEG